MRELAAHLVGAGLPLAQGLSLLEARGDDPALAAAVRGLREGVERGLSLDEAAAAFPAAFDTLFQASLRAGRADRPAARPRWRGSRASSCCVRRCALGSGARWPTPRSSWLLLAVVVAGLMLFVLPRFADLYAQFGEELPVATRLLMDAAAAAPVALPALAAAALGLWTLGRRALARPGARARADALVLRLPVLGPVTRHAQLIQASTMMAMLLEAGTPLREALALVADSVGNAVVGARLREAEAGGVARGRAPLGLPGGRRALSADLARHDPRGRDGRRAARDVRRRHRASMSRSWRSAWAASLALIEPVMMLAVGIVLGAVIITVYLPVFGISGVIR